MGDLARALPQRALTHTSNSKEPHMSKIHLHETRSLTPEQYVSGLTHFSPGRSKVLRNSADDYLKVHSVGSTEADVTEGSGGVWERLHYDWSNPDRVVLTISGPNSGGRRVRLHVHLQADTGREDRRGRGHRPGGQDCQRARPRAGARERRQGSAPQCVRRQHQGHRGARQRRAASMTAAAAGDAFGSMSRGVAASAAGTLAMDVSLYRQYRRDGRRESFAGWETSEGLETWDHAPGPALAAKRVLGAMLGREIPARYVRLNNTTHWGFGLATGAGYGLVVGR